MPTAIGPGRADRPGSVVLPLIVQLFRKTLWRSAKQLMPAPVPKASVIGDGAVGESDGAVIRSRVGGSAVNIHATPVTVGALVARDHAVRKRDRVPCPGQKDIHPAAGMRKVPLCKLLFFP